MRIDNAVIDAAQLVHATWVTADQASRVEQILFRFAQFSHRGHGLVDISEVTPSLATAFVNAPESDGSEPSLTKRRLRRTAIRSLFRSARARGASVGDPTLDLVLPSRGPRRTRH